MQTKWMSGNEVQVRMRIVRRNHRGGVTSKKEISRIEKFSDGRVELWLEDNRCKFLEPNETVEVITG